MSDKILVAYIDSLRAEFYSAFMDCATCSHFYLKDPDSYYEFECRRDGTHRSAYSERCHGRIASYLLKRCGRSKRFFNSQEASGACRS